MKSRRKFIKLGAAAAMGVMTPACFCTPANRTVFNGKGNKIGRGLVLWFSQTGNTERMGRLMAAVWQQAGVKVDASEVREFNPAAVAEYDLVLVGSPVNHYDAPAYLKTWLRGLPDLKGTPVAAFVTHGLPPSNQHNTACAVLEVLTERGGAPIGMATFGNLGTYPPYWAFYPEKALTARDKPDGETYARARGFARELLRKSETGVEFTFAREWSSGDLKKALAPVWFSKLLTDEHRIDSEPCILCGTCALKCPVGAIDPMAGTVYKDRCVDCAGCINNCPTGAVRMVYWGKELIGYREFLRRNGVVIPEPWELKG